MCADIVEAGSFTLVSSLDTAMPLTLLATFTLIFRMHWLEPHQCFESRVMKGFLRSRR